MKRSILILLTGALLSTATGYSQSWKTEPDARIKADPPAFEGYNPNFQKGSGDIFWQTTFDWADPSDPRGWSLPAGWTVGDETDLGNYWIWRNDSIKGQYTNAAPPADFATRADGFLLCPMDEYNYRDNISTENVADTWITTEPINCSGVSTVVVKFSQLFRLCCSNYHLDMMVTADAGVHWATYDVRYGTPGNEYPIAKYRRIEINISDVAAGMANVQIRFRMWGMDTYFWAIDDLQMTEAYDNNLELVDYWADFDGGNEVSLEHINYWPLTQMGMPGAVSGTVGSYFFKGAFLNSGSQDSENARLKLQVLKNGAEIFSETSSGNTIWTLERDTQRIVNPWLALDYGDYQFNFSGITDNPEEVPSNNAASLRFTVNDTLGHRADFTAETSGNTGGWVNGGNAGDMLSVEYPLYNAAEISSMTAYIASFTPAENPQFQYTLYKEIEGNWEEVITTEVVDMDSSKRNSWVTLPVMKDGETEYLTPGLYRACARLMGSRPDRPNGTQGMRIGRDLTTKFSGCQQYNAVGGTWRYFAGDPLWMIGFNLVESGGPTQAAVTFNVDMTRHIASGEFKPAADFVDVSGSFNNWGSSAHLTDADGDGIYTITLDGMPVGKVIEYKYRINGNWDTSEFPGGGPNRTYTVRYWNILNNLYNNGATSGVDGTGLAASFKVYPNPTEGAFTVDIQNTVPCDLSVVLTNIQGQEVYRNQVSGAVSHRETIDRQLPKGMYFLRMNNGSETQVRKVIIQ